MLRGFVLVFVITVPRLHAADPPKPVWRLLAQGGQASAPTSQGFAEFAGIAFTRDLPLGHRFGLSVEAYPALLIHQTRTLRAGRETIPAVSAGGLLTYAIGFGRSRFGLRLEGGAGLFYSRDPVPAAGSRFNFFDQGGAQLSVRLGDDRRLWAGYRRVHISNLGLVGDDNPGLSFHSLVLAIDL